MGRIGVTTVDDAVSTYIAEIDPAHRPLFDRLHGLILAVAPAATVSISYGIPTYRTDGHRLYLGAWKHGVSLYGWQETPDAGFVARHPELVTGKGTIQLRPDAAATITDDELTGLISAALGVSGVDQTG